MLVDLLAAGTLPSLALDLTPTTSAYTMIVTLSYKLSRIVQPKVYLSMLSYFRSEARFETTTGITPTWMTSFS